VPVSLYLDSEDDCLYGFSTLGQKIRWMRENPAVCIEIEEVVSRVNWTTVLVFGRYEEIPKNDRGAELRRRAQELFNRQPQWWLPGTATLAPDEQHPLPVVYRIRINKLTGRRAARPSE
jgi:nitroimidazol reductase NimA-like FMN-containing flavoprotein (pyridoxamine 5'-phosphate oxidase superfamily)